MRKHRSWNVLICLLVLFLIVPLGQASASTISVKLENYLGNRTSINFDTKGSYKLANDNSRFSGADRFEVAYNIASNGWNSAETVIVVNYLAFADALAAAPLAAKYNAPILLVKPSELPVLTDRKIRELGASKAIIIGGTGSISLNVENSLRSFVPNVERIGGANRFEVAGLVAGRLGNTTSAIVTNGLVFSDALAIAPYAAKNEIPILLTASNSLPDSTRAALQGRSSTLVIGGEGSVNNNVYGQLPSPNRIGGADRYEVSANIIKQLNLNSETVYLSSGFTFADALTGSVLAAKQGAPLMLTKSTELPAVIRNTMVERNTGIVNVLGGPGSVSETVVGSLPNEYWIQPGTSHNVRVENSKLALYKGAQKVKDFTGSFTLETAYTDANQLTIYGTGPRAYLGNMEFANEGGYVKPINRNIPFEDYLKGVVPREMPSSWAVEALKAQAVAARTYSIDDMGKTVYDSQRYQVYGGYDWDQSTNIAVDATRGQVMKYNGKLISAVFSSSNGGYTVSNFDEWGTSPVAYLTSQADPFDTSYKWNVSMLKNQIDMTGKDLKNYGHWWWSTAEAETTLANNLKNWLYSNGYANQNIKIVEIKNFAIDPQRNGSNRSINASLVFDFYVYGQLEPTGELKRFTASMPNTVRNFRTMFGTMNFKSTLIDNVDLSTDKVIINGSGFGHGVGLSQHGAYNRAKQGQNYQQILEFYYKGAQLTNY
jgi:SpoIID/LytB domain protein